MNAILRTIAMYVFLMLVFRVAGRRTLADSTAFDFVLVLVISEATQQALIGEDFSLTTSFLVTTTFIGLDVALSLWKQRSPTVERLLDGVPLILVAEGKPLKERMIKARVDEDDILLAARQNQGLERMDQIKYAILERNGGISVIPKDKN